MWNWFVGIFIERLIIYMGDLIKKIIKQKQQETEFQEDKDEANAAADKHESLTGVEAKTPEEIAERRKAFEDAINKSN